MGIDKSNIRYVIHYNMPKDLESYYQEAGRAGRDGDKSKCILLFNRADIVSNKFLIEQTESESNHKNEYNKLNDIIDYCNTDKCLRKYILEYFDETPEFDNCNNCSNCLSETEITDITIDAKKILSCIVRMNQKYGTSLVTDVLKGSKSSKIKAFGFDNLSTYGIMQDYSKDTIKELIYFLITENYIKSIGDKYPILMLDQNAKEILHGNKKVLIKRKIEKVSSVTASTNADFDEKLFEILRGLRRKVAEENNVPPFIVFGDVSLKEMATYFPVNRVSMLSISGVGVNKLENYGDIFIKTIKQYVDDNDIKLSDKPIKIVESKEKSSAKEDTKITSYNLFVNDKKSIDEVAEIRGLTRRTVEEHLLKCYENGMEINLNEYINEDFRDDVYCAIEQVGYERLRDIKDLVPNEVDYFNIKYFVIDYKKESSNQAI